MFYTTYRIHKDWKESRPKNNAYFRCFTNSKNNINTGKRAKAEICLNNCNNGSRNASSFLNQPTSKPNETPTTIARMSPDMERCKLANKCSHRSPVTIKSLIAKITSVGGLKK